VWVCSTVPPQKSRREGNAATLPPGTAPTPGSPAAARCRRCWPRSGPHRPPGCCQRRTTQLGRRGTAARLRRWPQRTLPQHRWRPLQRPRKGPPVAAAGAAGAAALPPTPPRRAPCRWRLPGLPPAPVAQCGGRPGCRPR
jgi:hypothetical protein